MELVGDIASAPRAPARADPPSHPARRGSPGPKHRGPWPSRDRRKGREPPPVPGPPSTAATLRRHARHRPPCRADDVSCSHVSRPPGPPLRRTPFAVKAGPPSSPPLAIKRRPPLSRARTTVAAAPPLKLWDELTSQLAERVVRLFPHLPQLSVKLCQSLAAPLRRCYHRSAHRPPLLPNRMRGSGVSSNTFPCQSQPPPATSSPELRHPRRRPPQRVTLRSS